VTTHFSNFKTTLKYRSIYRQYSPFVPTYKYSPAFLDIITVMPWLNAWYFLIQINARILSEALQQLQPWFGEHAEELREMMPGSNPKQRGVVPATFAVEQYSAVDFANMVVDMGPAMAVFVGSVVARAEDQALVQSAPQFD
jgi:hypothetical protein